MILCFDIGGSLIRGAAAETADRLVPIGRAATPRADFEAFAAAIRRLADAAPVPADAPVALSITGVVDTETGLITVANIPGIDGRPLAADLAARLGRRVLVANDADCFALAEARLGAGRGHRIVFGAILGTGVGGGLVIDGRLVEGAGGFAGEWGHGPIAATRAGDPPVEIPSFPCGCGQAGCLDTVGGARGLERLHRHLAGVAADSRAIVDGWRAGDPAATRSVDVQIDLVAGPLALVVNTVGAGIVPVGGGLGGVPAFVARLDAAVRARILRRSAAPVVVPAALAGDPGLTGAALLALGAAP